MSKTITDSKFVFIGGGNMGQALVGGLLAGGCLAQNITIVDTSEEVIAKLKQLFPDCHLLTQTEAALSQADIVILAVKPQVMQSACQPIAEQCQSRRPLIISIAAGVITQNIDSWLGGQLPIVRCMPNTPALVQSGVTALYSNTEVDPSQQKLADEVLTYVGTTLWFDNETDLDAVTAISGSGPAYFFYVMEAMIEAGVSLGLSQEQSKVLTLHTAEGAAKLITQIEIGPAQLRQAVTSKGGTTEAAINILDENKVKEVIKLAINNAASRSRELSKLN